MRISDWSSDVCSSDLHLVVIAGDIDDVRAALGALHDAADDRIVPLGPVKALLQSPAVDDVADQVEDIAVDVIEEIERSEEHTSELQSLMRISYAVFCLKKNNKVSRQQTPTLTLVLEH